jgi:hypothetical protein
MSINISKVLSMDNIEIIIGETTVYYAKNQKVESFMPKAYDGTYLYDSDNCCFVVDAFVNKKNLAIQMAKALVKDQEWAKELYEKCNEQLKCLKEHI